MRSIVKTIEHDSRSDVFTVVLLGDVHLGAAACDEVLFQQCINRIRDGANTFFIAMGDMADAVHRHDKRHREDTMARWLHGKGAIIKHQRDRLIDLLRPIGPQCLAYVLGNHEDAIDKETSSDIYLDVIEAIRATPDTDIRMGLSGWLLLKFRRTEKGGTQAYRFFLHHGWNGGDLMGSNALKLERLSESYEADVYVMGHTHKRIAFPTVVTGIDRNGNITAETRYHINSGSFLRCALPDAVTYTEAKGKKPVSLGWVELELRPGADGDKIRVSQL